MIKYSELMREEVFDWNFFLNKKMFTDEELSAAYDLSNEWVTCACGQQCAVIPRRNWDGEPLDGVLKQLGHSFNNAIYDMRHHLGIDDEKFDSAVSTARNLLLKIEDRSTFLIENYYKSTNVQ